MANDEVEGFKRLVRTDIVDPELDTVAEKVRRIVSDEIGNAEKTHYVDVVVVSGTLPNSQKNIRYQILRLENEPEYVSIFGQHPTHTVDDAVKLRLKNIEDILGLNLDYSRTQSLRPFMQYTPSAFKRRMD